ncbi:tetratricopeptide repeat protein [Ereboglobus sp. PH5-10]|uniref:tetratricopeptide repeat protein n=1 Tax=Ereboglobus sp. PH5-10 TaxID=2940629 RepID=UPI00240707E8|nr:tetratricopeptide repeat protein [Ereboglobus sp. PH5-10]
MTNIHDTTAASQARSPAHRRRIWVAVLALVLATAAAYHNSFSGEFIFDDIWSISRNESIRQLSTAFSPPNTFGETVSGRPLLNFSFAINYRISGKEVWSYHLGNLLIHVAAGLSLFGLARRTLLRPVLRAYFGGDSSTLVAFVIAALWLLHPLQTESVTYIVQRAESLMALFYILTLYCFVRGVDSAGARTFWLALSVAACLLGMASKEVMVSAPLMVFLYDRTFAAGSFREAWKRRKVYHALLASTLLLLGWLVWRAGGRGGTAGFGTETTVWTYALTQIKAIPHYLRLVVWPRGQVFDYGSGVVARVSSVWPQALLLVALGGATVWALIRKPALGFPGFLFFAVLAPSSSVIPVATQTMAEHRMYLPLAATVSAIAVAAWLVAGRRSQWLLIAAAAALAVATFQRNAVYRDQLSLWRDVVAGVPGNARAHNNLGNLYAEKNMPERALAHCRRAIELNPNFAQAYNNYGYALAKLERHQEALAYYDKALGFREHGSEIALANRGYSLFCLGRLDEATDDFIAALKIRSDCTAALSNYGNVLCSLGRYDEALAMLDKAVAVDPKFATAWNNRGNVFSARGTDTDEALRCYKLAAGLDPSLWAAVDNVARYLLALGRHGEAVPYFEASIPISPDAGASHFGLGTALMLSGRPAEAVSHFEQALARQPTAGCHHNLAVALFNTGRAGESIAHFEASLRLDPQAASAHHNYAVALAALGRIAEAVAAERAALRIAPGFAPAREQLERLAASPGAGAGLHTPDGRSNDSPTR